MEQEQVIKQSSNNVLTLTNCRVVYDAANSGESGYMSIPLDQVAHCGLVTSQNFLLAVAAAFLMLIGAAFALSGRNEGVPVMVVGVLFILIYYATKKARLTIASSAGGEISVRADLKRADSIAFLWAVEDQRRDFMKKLYCARPDLS
jgi:hypothetical protein